MTWRARTVPDAAASPTVTGPSSGAATGARTGLPSQIRTPARSASAASARIQRAGCSEPSWSVRQAFQALPCSAAGSSSRSSSWAGKPSSRERRGVLAHVIGLLLGRGHPQRSHPSHGIAHAQLCRQRVHLLLRFERACIDRGRVVASPEIDRVVVEGGQAGDQEAAVAAARPARHRVPLQHEGLDPVARQPPGAGEAAHAGADHAGLHLDVARPAAGAARRARRASRGGRRASHRAERLLPAHAVRVAPSRIARPCASSSPARTASRRPRIRRSMKVRLCSVTRRLAVSSPARIR